MALTPRDGDGAGLAAGTCASHMRPGGSEWCGGIGQESRGRHVPKGGGRGIGSCVTQGGSQSSVKGQWSASDEVGGGK
jgi:hypothetical protein